jgi:cell division protein FtsZ
VVATGIDGTGDVQSSAPRSSYALGGSRAPKRPVLELPSEDEFELAAEAQLQPERGEASAFDAEAEDEPLDLGTMAGSAFDEEDEDAEEYDDVEGIVDPLAGLRNDADSGASEPADEDEDEDEWGAEGQSDTEEPLDLAAQAQPAQDELLLDADRLAAEDEPVRPMLGGGRRRGLVSGGDSGSGGGGGGGGAGSTLFERMANLSRGGSKLTDEEDEEEEGDDSGSASLSIPRFLGRQNNQ